MKYLKTLFPNPNMEEKITEKHKWYLHLISIFYFIFKTLVRGKLKFVIFPETEHCTIQISSLKILNVTLLFYKYNFSF